MSEIIYKIEIKTTDKLCAGKISKTTRFSIRKRLLSEHEFDQL